MASVNKVMLIGNLGADPEIRHLPSGDAVANVRLATSETWKDKSGEKQERTEWHSVVFFGKVAEIVQRYLRKGSKIYLEGKLRTRKWTDKAGADRYTTEIVVDIGGTMQMLDGKQGTQDAPSAALVGQGGYGQGQARQAAPAPSSDVDEDIPF